MFTVTKAVALLLTPPGVLIFLTLLGLMLQVRWRRIGIGLSALSAGALLALSLPITADVLFEGLEHATPPLPTADIARQTGIGAIVVLGGGRITASPEY